MFAMSWSAVETHSSELQIQQKFLLHKRYVLFKLMVAIDFHDVLVKSFSVSGELLFSIPVCLKVNQAVVNRCLSGLKIIFEQWQVEFLFLLSHAWAQTAFYLTWNLKCRAAIDRARNFLFNALGTSTMCLWACPNHKTTCPKIDNHNNTKG